jgi:OOP family OmpA-OmpF porin
MNVIRSWIALPMLALLLAACGVHEGMGVERPGVAPQSASASDNDGDGILDQNDECPGTPFGVTVDRNGCPIDDDGDGVANYKDACEGTPQGVEVDQVGCALDDDGDGVSNNRDQCPDTPRGLEVNEVGCSLEQALNQMGPVRFDLDKATLRPMGEETLRKVAEAMKRYPDKRVRIIGHTDALNTQAYNLDLSQRRAQSAIEFLVSQGIDRDRLVAEGRGESEPIATNETPEGRQKNRRVVWRVINPG